MVVPDHTVKSGLSLYFTFLKSPASHLYPVYNGSQARTILFTYIFTLKYEFHQGRNLSRWLTVLSSEPGLVSDK